VKKHHIFGLISGIGLALCCAALVYVIGFTDIVRVEYAYIASGKLVAAVIPPPQLDKVDYDKRMNALANNDPTPVLITGFKKDLLATSTYTGTSTPESAGTVTNKNLWPAKAVYPNAGAILPFNRVLAYYGNFYSTGMGILGELPPDAMLSRLQSAVAEWQKADPSTPVIPAIEYIAVTAQGSAGPDGSYSIRMPDSQIEKAISLADQIHGIVILDVQSGLSDLQGEIAALGSYLKLPNVHLAIDPEFNMKYGGRPGYVIGSVDASDVNAAAQYLAGLVRDNDLPPKILVVHRFTEHMVTNYQNIRPLPEVQVVMDMDGWGYVEKKENTYGAVVYSEPVQFAGIKLFYKNDLKPPSTGIMTQAQVLQLKPKPIYIQYQ